MVQSAHCASLCCFPARSLCCCAARTHRVGRAGRDAASLLACLLSALCFAVPFRLVPLWAVQPPALCFTNLRSIDARIDARLCCFPARPHRPGRAGRDAVSLLPCLCCNTQLPRAPGWRANPSCAGRAGDTTPLRLERGSHGVVKIGAGLVTLHPSAGPRVSSGLPQ